MGNIRMRIAVASCALALACMANAVAAAGLQLKTEAFQESTQADGKPKRVKAEKVVPGNQIVYVISYHNAGDKPASNVVIDIPVPSDLAFEPGTATGSDSIQESVDGGKSYGDLATLKVAAKAAQGTDVTHVRWKMTRPIKPDESGEVSFRATVK